MVDNTEVVQTEGHDSELAANLDSGSKEVKQLPLRSEVPIGLTWDLSSVFAADEDFEKACEALQERLALAEGYQKRLRGSAGDCLAGVEYVLDVYRKMEPIYTYAHLKHDQDTANSVYQAMYAKAGALYTNAGEALAWLEPEVLALTDEEIEEFFAVETGLALYRKYISDMTRSRAHILPAEMESLLAGAGEVLHAAGDIFGVLNNADLRFPVVEDDKGEKVQLSHGLYGRLLECTNRKVRKDAFEGLYSVFQQFRNTLAATLSTQVKCHNYLARVRGFESARGAALHSGRIPEAVYDTLVGVVKKSLPLLHRYVALRKRLLGLEELHMYDLYTPLLGEPPIRFSYEAAREQVLRALAPLGGEYQKVLEEAFEERWIDVVENRGKRSGAYSSGCYDTAPFILLNWHDGLDQAFTLAHELGHSVHSYFTRKNQPFVYGDYSIFLAEIASTTNENLLTEYLLETQTDPMVRAYVLNHYLDGFKGTVFRQTQFAEFEHFIHEEDAAGAPLTSEHLSERYSALNQEYYGGGVVSDPEIALEWSRIPHFYYNYYVYQYATGFSAASALAGRISAGEAGALEQYLCFLKAGSSDDPIAVMKKAGVDMTRAEYLEAAVEQFESRLSELEILVESELTARSGSQATAES